jgi:hypothetical protein
VSGALLVTPLTGALEVDGELLAAPFVAISLCAAVEVLADAPRRRSAGAGLVCGASAMAAVLVKQNMVDGFVFVVAVSLGLQVTGHRHLARRARLLAVSATAGSLLGAAVASVWTLAHGTSVTGVAWAMYPFRLEATRAIVARPSTGALGRIHVLIHGAWLSGLVPCAVVVLVAVARAARPGRSGPGSAEGAVGPPPRVVAAALLLVALYDAFSVAMGGNSWLHYLVEAVAPVAVAVAVVVAAMPRTTSVAAGLVALSAVVAYTTSMPPHGEEADRLGAAIGAVSHRGDTIVTAFGHAQVTSVSGLRSPYPYLWSLPAHVLDPHLALLDRILSSRRAPTWFVLYSRPGPHLWNGRTRLDLRTRYHEVDLVSGHVVLLRDGVRRASPALRG